MTLMECVAEVVRRQAEGETNANLWFRSVEWRGMKFAREIIDDYVYAVPGGNVAYMWDASTLLSEWEIVAAADALAGK